jgi:hypothetical protein
VVGEADFVALSSRVDDKVVVEVEEETAGILVVHLAATIGLVLADDFAAVFLMVFWV